MLTLTLFLACAGGAKTDDSTAATDDSGATTDDSGATDDSTAADDSADDTAPTCDPMTSGDDWAWLGECPQMRTPCDIVVDGCSLTIDYSADGGMTMGMPYSATIEGSTVTFSDDNSVSGCVGTLESADKVTGTCSNGCTFTLRR